MKQGEKIGDFLVRIGAITVEQRDEILEVQKKEPHKMFGYIAVELNIVNQEALDNYLSSTED